MATSPSSHAHGARRASRGSPLPSSTQEKEATTTITTNTNTKTRTQLEHEFKREADVDLIFGLAEGVHHHDNDNLAGHLFVETTKHHHQEEQELRASDSMNADSALWGSAALLLMAAVCGTNFPIIKDLEATHPESNVAALRFLIAAAPFLTSLSCPPAVAMAGAEIGAWCALGYLCQAVGLHLTSAAKAAFICALFTVVAPMAAAVGLVGERKNISLGTCGSVALAVAGTAVLEIGPTLLSGGELSQSLSGVNQGDVWCLGTAVGFGLMFARMEHHMEEHSKYVLELTAWQCAVLASAMVGWALVDSGGDLPGLLATAPSYGLKDCAYLLWTGLFTTAAVLWGETKVMQTVSSTQAGIIFSTEPLFATGFAALLLHEQVGVSEAAGAALIMASCISIVLQGDDSAKSD